ncbi:MAG: penicillin-binding transpeptidase domain-containing protein [Actinomycetota bacterium]|nr:penicillin-binding transpeptidase domain-containing protein [Actinomycetota bacterium]
MTGTWRLAGVGIVLAVMLGALGLRLWTIQVTETDEYNAEAERNLIRVVPTPAPRGDVFDRNGELLAGTRASLAVVVDMGLLEDDFEEDLAGRLSAFLDQPASEILDRFERANSGAQIILAEDLTERQALILFEHREDFPGVAVIPQPIRDYPGGELAAQVLGYIGNPSEADLERPGVKGTDVVGKAGIERFYDDQLRGTEGVIKYQVDAGRSVLQRLGEQESTPGNNLILTIDSGIQAQLQESLEAGLRLARDLEMTQRGEALAEENGSIASRLFLAREALQLEAERAALEAEAAAADPNEAGTVTDEDSIAVDSVVEIDEGEVLGSLYPGLPIDDDGVCVPVQRVEVGVANRTLLSGIDERTMRLEAVVTDRSRRIAVVDVDGERFEVEEGDAFATTLRVIAITDDGIVASHSDAWCPVRAVGVVEDPNDGSIMAMASYPSFDPSAFVSGLTQREWESLGTINAFTNFAVQGQYAPASTFKAVSYVLALEEEIYPLDRPVGDRVLGDGGSEAAPPEDEDSEVPAGDEEGEVPADDEGADEVETPTTPAPSDEELQPLTSDTDLYNCTGSLRFEFNDGSSQVYRDWKRNGHGPLDLHGALQASCDLYFWEISLRIWNERSDETGINNEDLWQEWARSFGFGVETGIDLPFEKPGLIPDRQWFREEQRKDTGRVRATGPWVGGDLMNAVVGQGAVLVTPLQLGNGFSAMLNGGTLWKPRVLSETVDQDGNVVSENPKTVMATVDIDPATARALRRDFQQVVNGPIGTARGAFVGFGPGVGTVGGKTGTAEIIKAEEDVQEVDTAWFIGVAPVMSPDYVVTVVVERGGSGGRVAAPVARQVLQYILNGEGAVTPIQAGADMD